MSKNTIYWNIIFSCSGYYNFFECACRLVLSYGNDPAYPLF